jgi:3-methyladenine DNA glycosylase AlkD
VSEAGGSSADALVYAIRAGLRGAADPARAPAMQAYMKSSTPYLGVGVPLTRKIVRTLAIENPPTDLDHLAASATTLWRTAEFREECYAATELTGLGMAIGQLEMLPLCREMIITGAWWDHVDAVSHRIGAMLMLHSGTLLPMLRDWSTDPDRWLRRSSIICQLGFKARTDVDLLTEVIEVNLGDREFFIRKAIGWALREYARTDPGWVRAFVDEHAAVISPLSRREALKHLG